MRRTRNGHLKEIQDITLPLTCLKGVGPKRAQLLAQKGLHTVLDLLFFIPIRYEDRSRICPIKETKEGRAALVTGRVISGREETFFPSRRRLFKIVIRDREETLELLWFQYKKPHLTRFATPGMELLVYGRTQTNKGHRQMIHPEVKVLDHHRVEVTLGICPVYSSTAGISANTLRTTIRTALDNYLGRLIDPIPADILRRLSLPDLATAIKNVHLPSKELSVDILNRFESPYHWRLLFDRFFLVMLTMAYRKKSRETKPSPSLSVPSGLMKDLEAFFPFELTSGQTGAIRDMVEDFNRGKTMNRLLLGDVGCGKTVVAAVAAYIGVYNNQQVAVMVPTQELANQHFDFFEGLSGRLGFRPVLLTSRLKEAERQEVYGRIENMANNLVIGTHSLVQEGVSFANLSLVIIDEQQRFGVRDRALLDQKGENPHLLVMTATPIPRTLALTVYGDMDISIIKGYPKGHKTAATYLVPQVQKRRVFETLKQRMSKGEQAFVICPVIESSEDLDLKNAIDMAEKLKKILSPPFRIGLVHGRLAPPERERTMNDFREGLIDLLVGTTVVEVGVHVPRATVMVIEHPERFGLAQLHQLRGRVGRGSERGLCLLMLSKNIPESAVPRLKILAENQNGFEIAQKDLEVRGQGQLTGMRQAGVGEIDFQEMIRESDLLSMARREARCLIESDPQLSRPKHGRLKGMVESILARSLDL